VLWLGIRLRRRLPAAGYRRWLRWMLWVVAGGLIVSALG
jgi:hypothetical protein